MWLMQRIVTLLRQQPQLKRALLTIQACATSSDVHHDHSLTCGIWSPQGCRTSTFHLLSFPLLHSPWLANVIFWLLSQVFALRTQALEYVFPSDPHTGAYSIVHADGRQMQAAPWDVLTHLWSGWLHLDFSQGSGSVENKIYKN